MLGWRAATCGYTNCSNMSNYTGPVTVGSQKRTDRWSCFSLDRTKRLVSTAGRKKLIEPEPNWFSIRCNSPIRSFVISSGHTKPPFVHVAAELPFYFLLPFCDCCNVMTQQSTSNKWNKKFFEFLFLLVPISFHKSAYLVSNDQLKSGRFEWNTVFILVAYPHYLPDIRIAYPIEYWHIWVASRTFSFPLNQTEVWLLNAVLLGRSG